MPKHRAQAHNIVIVMPAYNEADVVAAVVEETLRVAQVPIILVDDYSDDDTAVMAENAGAEVLSLPRQLGAWGAAQTGIRYAIRQGYDVVVTMDSDGQHRPETLKALLQPVLDDAADVTIGAFCERGSGLRKVAWALFRSLTGIRIEDLTSGLRAHNLKAAKLLANRRANFLDFQDVGVLALLLEAGLRVGEVQVQMQPRVNGQSRIFRSWLRVGLYMAHTVLLGVTKRPLSFGRRGELR